ncbi:MAG: hypothetical protein BWY91_01948 [bacterium ADurb.BinA028]|nr:MAG: hypothetical protein BWY91_01948 [bacterium ADurb.BinA028]
MAPPTRMPTTGTTAIGTRGTTPVASRIVAVGRAPAQMGTNPQIQPRDPGGATRRPAVTDATASMRAAKPAVSHQESRTAAMTDPTRANWSVARRAAVTWARE